MNPNTILVHDRDGCFWMDKDKWPVLRLDCEKGNPKILEEAETQREGGMMLESTSTIEEILAEKGGRRKSMGDQFATKKQER